MRWLAVIAGSVTLMVGIGVRPAVAHGGEEEGTARQFVLAAIALLVNDPTDHDAILDKVKDAQEAKDQKGVDLDLVARAQTAFESGKPHAARSLLERSIGAKPHRGNGEPAEIREVS